MNELTEACENGNIEKVKYLVEKGVDIHAYNDQPLRWAVFYGQLEVIKYFIEKGTNIHADDDYALRLAVKHGHHKVVNYLREVVGDKWKCFNCIVKAVCLNLCENYNKGE